MRTRLPLAAIPACAIAFAMPSTVTAQVTAMNPRPPVEPRTTGLRPDARCAATLKDQADRNRCLEASSVATFGALFPYPGLGNEFSPQAFVGGGQSNRASGDWSTVGGGYDNAAFGGRATVAGGQQNNASSSNATVGGGVRNQAPGGLGTIAGGSDNEAGYYAAVGGGDANEARGGHSTIGGGSFNTALGGSATVPGGQLNTATGGFSFAAGRSAKAAHDGAFVWGDSQFLEQASSAVDRFNVYACGGARIFSSSDASSGVLLAPGAGSWSSVSRRASKESLEPVDPRAILAGVLALPIATWNCDDDSLHPPGGDMSEHEAEVIWKRDGAVFTDNRYSRGHRWSFDGGVEVPASASPSVVRAPFSVAAAVDPEEAFVASLTSCHMLWFLSLAARRGYVVESYRDRASGVMGKDTEGGLAMTRVTLHPEVSFAGEPRPTAEDLEALHHEAHENCFIARSVKTEVRCEPVG